MSGPRLDALTTELLASSLREVFAVHEPGFDVAGALERLGWDEVVKADPVTAIRLLFTEQGRALALSRTLDTVVLGELSEAIPGSTAPRAVVYPADGWEGLSPRTRTRGLVLGPLEKGTELVVPIHTECGTALALVCGNDAVPARGFAGGTGWQTIELTVPTPQTVKAPWERAVAAAHRALAAELVGVCDAAIAVAVSHTTDRYQYGRPIASFQAVRHRLSECYVRIQAAREMNLVAWDSSAGVVEATIAKILAGRAQSEVMRNLLQVQGALGLTLEAVAHQYVTRGALLDSLLGTHSALNERLGAMLLAGAPILPCVQI